MTMSQLLEKIFSKPTECRHQFLSECAFRVKTMRGKGNAGKVEVTFGTTTDLYIPKSLLFPSKAPYVGIIVWIPRDEYLKAHSSQAIRNAIAMSEKEGR